MRRVEEAGARVAEDLRLTHCDQFDGPLFEVPAAELWRHLPGPSLFSLSGRNPQPLFVSILLHGNEDTGWRAIQEVMRRHERTGLPRSLLLFVGNIDAAKANLRTLAQQVDYNRTWPGTPHGDTAEARLMREVVSIVKAHKPFASIDIHNNTGNNPHYACLNKLDERFLHLARLFSRTVVFFQRPEGVQSAALAEFCPAVTIECGRPAGMAGTEHAAEFVAAALALSHFPDHSVPEGDLDLLQTFAIVKVPAAATFSYNGSDADFRFRADLDRLNFSVLAPGVSFGTLGVTDSRLEVLPASEYPLNGSYFSYDGGEIALAQPAIPAMLTLDPEAVRLDCLGYLMHRIGRAGNRIAT